MRHRASLILERVLLEAVESDAEFPPLHDVTYWMQLCFVGTTPKPAKAKAAKRGAGAAAPAPVLRKSARVIRPPDRFGGDSGGGGGDDGDDDDGHGGGDDGDGDDDDGDGGGGGGGGGGGKKRTPIHATIQAAFDASFASSRAWYLQRLQGDNQLLTYAMQQLMAGHETHLVHGFLPRLKNFCRQWAVANKHGRSSDLKASAVPHLMVRAILEAEPPKLENGAPALSRALASFAAVQRAELLRLGGSADDVALDEKWRKAHLPAMVRYHHAMLRHHEDARDGGAGGGGGGGGGSGAPDSPQERAPESEREVDEAGTGRNATFRVAGEGRSSGPRLFTLTPIAGLRVGFAYFDERVLKDGGFKVSAGGPPSLLDTVFDRRQRNLPRSSVVGTDGDTLIIHYDKVRGGGAGVWLSAQGTGLPTCRRKDSPTILSLPLRPPPPQAEDPYPRKTRGGLLADHAPRPVAAHALKKPAKKKGAGQAQVPVLQALGRISSPPQEEPRRAQRGHVRRLGARAARCPQLRHHLRRRRRARSRERPPRPGAGPSRRQLRAVRVAVRGRAR